MSAKKVSNPGILGNSVKLAGRSATLDLSAEKLTIHKNGIEFRSPSPFTEWSEMTVSLQSPVDGSHLSCHGIVVACTGTKHAGFHIAMLFTGMTPQAEKQLGEIARTQFGTL
jgi:hypothetical protein